MIRFSVIMKKYWCRIRALHLLSPSILVTASSCDHSIKVWGLDTDRLDLHTSNVCNSWPLSHRSLFDVRLWCWKCHRWYPDSLTPLLIHGEVDTMIDGTNNHECYIQNVRMKVTLSWHYFSWYNCQQGISSPPSLQCGHWLQGDLSLSLAPRIEVNLNFACYSLFLLNDENQSLIQLLHVLCSRWFNLF